VPEHVIVVPNTVGDGFTPGDGLPRRAALGIEGRCILLTVGRMAANERYKGHNRHDSRDSGPRARDHDIVYVVIGQGDDRVRLEQLARKAGVAERVRFLGDVGAQDLAAAYRMADLFVMVSTGEGFGIAFLEAMASGTPALRLNVGGVRDALAGELGTVVSGEDDLAAAIACLLSAPRLDPENLSQAVHTHFNREAFRAQVAMALGRLCNQHYRAYIG
jgi:phosphatidyl-myo-inositol dimannoside synthase